LPHSQLSAGEFPAKSHAQFSPPALARPYIALDERTALAEYEKPGETVFGKIRPSQNQSSIYFCNALYLQYNGNKISNDNQKMT